MREIGGAAGVAAVSTVLVSQTGLDGFHAAFGVIAVAAALGVLTAATGVFDASQFRPAWIKDPDGNTMALTQRSH